MKRSTVYFFIDLGSFAALIGMVSTGFVLRTILPPGSGRLMGEGTGAGAAEKSIALLWGLTRQEWGDLHFWTSLTLLALLALHLFFHWRWIAAVIRNQPKEHSGVRFALGIVGFLSVTVFALSPFISPVRQVPRYRAVEEKSSEPEKEIRLRDKNWIRGSMTLGELESKTGVPVDVLLEELELPATISADSQLGRLSRVYGFDMEEVHAILDRYEEIYEPQ